MKQRYDFAPPDHVGALNAAREEARRSGKPYYVLPGNEGRGWRVTAERPDAFWSHWRSMPDGSLQAHVETNSDGVYRYELVEPAAAGARP